MEELFKWATLYTTLYIGLYIGVGSLFATVETMDRMNGRDLRINRIKVIVAWLPGLFIKKVGLWIKVGSWTQTNRQ